MIVKLQTEHHLEFLSLKGGCRGSSKSTLVKMPHYWKSHVTVLIYVIAYLFKTFDCLFDLIRNRTLSNDSFESIS